MPALTRWGSRRSPTGTRPASPVARHSWWRSPRSSPLQPAYLILDEPTSQLDPQGTRLVGDALRRLARTKQTAILLAEHKTALLDRLADRVVLIDQGVIVRSGPAAEVLGDPALIDHGVEPPPRVRVRTALAAAGLESVGVTDQLLAELAS